MTTEDTGTDYRGLCPNGQKEYFHEHSTELVASSIHWGNVERNSKAPSRIKDELEHLAKVISKLSPRAKTAMDHNAEVIPSDNVVDDLLQHIDDAIYTIRSGRAKHEHVRGRLGYDAAEIWYAHDGDILSDDFVSFLETLIEDVNAQASTPVNADAKNLARDVRKLIC